MQQTLASVASESILIQKTSTGHAGSILVNGEAICIDAVGDRTLTTEDANIKNTKARRTKMKKF